LNAKIGIFLDFSGDFGLRHKIIYKAAPRYWRWWRGVVGNAFRLQRSYSTPSPVSTAMGDCLRAGTAIGFRASREYELKFLFLKVGKFAAFSERPKAKNVSASGGFAPCPPDQELCPSTSLGASPPDPHYRGFTLVYGASNSPAPILVLEIRINPRSSRAIVLIKMSTLAGKSRPSSSHARAAQLLQTKTYVCVVSDNFIYREHEQMSFVFLPLSPDLPLKMIAIKCPIVTIHMPRCDVLSAIFARRQISVIISSKVNVVNIARD